ncbi:metallophosphoesterase family protein [Ureibacillus chungkukjangi]|uniref:PhoD-like phosphatase n=1 Tax=Ureibacillus chungkukjangi TaxID=1202712 RepID=A0A318U3G4_9BACL|nr:hypothetical protein [Ureibacillus chungkukjangi]PYF08925.1 hypothetical protein BJ095_101146 [Ureibacillus chungkukjangi]
MNPDLFPALLAGPMIRRLESSQVYIWVATSKDYEITAEVYEIISSEEADNYTKLASATDTSTIQFGKNLFIHLLKITPNSNKFPTNQIIGYNLHFQNKKEQFDLEMLGLLKNNNPQSIVYDSLKYPTFFIPEKSSEFSAKFLFGSCRKLHGEGEDLLAKGDQLLVDNSRDISNRPDALFLMGDQIYADDVADPIFYLINQFGKALMGVNEDLVTVDKRLANYSSALHKINARKDIIKDMASLSTRKGSNHLIEFGEFAAMYLLAWSPILWEIAQEGNLYESFDNGFEKGHFHLKLTRATDKLKKLEKTQLQNRFTEQEKLINGCPTATYKIRRLLANIPTYMIFDDHDITDDLNINADWKEKVTQSPLGKHIVANGLAAFFAFQGWGNEPQVFKDAFIPGVKEYFKDLCGGNTEASYKEWIALIMEHQPWHFVAPTNPRAVFLDTRTLREYDDKPNTTIIEQLVKERAYPPQLVNEDEYKSITKQLQSSGWVERDPLIIISPTPVIGFDLIEKAILQFLPTIEILGAHVQTIFDVEAWRYNGKGLTNFLNQLSEWNPGNTVVLSGDVHYSFSATANFTFSDEKEMSVKQITASPLKNMSFKNFGTLMKITTALKQVLQQEFIYRFCDLSYLIQDTDKKSLPIEDFLWKEQLHYAQIEGKSIIETDNTLGEITFFEDRVENRFIK